MFSVATDFSRAPVAKEFSLSLQNLHGPIRDRVSCVATWHGAGMVEVCARNSTQCVHDNALCMQQTCNSALCCALFGPLYMDTVKKKSTKRTLENWGVTIFILLH